jgi:hypothetical protein
MRQARNLRRFDETAARRRRQVRSLSGPTPPSFAPKIGCGGRSISVSVRNDLVLPRRHGAGPVAQWLELAAHNRLVGGSSPPGPTTQPDRTEISRIGGGRGRIVRFRLAGRVSSGQPPWLARRFGGVRLSGLGKSFPRIGHRRGQRLGSMSRLALRRTEYSAMPSAFSQPAGCRRRIVTVGWSSRLHRAVNY